MQTELLNNAKSFQSTLIFNKFPKCVEILGKSLASHASYREEFDVLLPYKSNQKIQYFPIVFL